MTPVPSPRLLAPLSLALLGLSLPAFGQAGRDKIRLKDGKDQDVQIETEEYGGVTFKPARGAPATAPWGDVRSIQYGGSTELTAALANFNAGRLAEAEKELEELKADAKLRPVLRQQVLYHLAQTLHRQGKFDAAIAAYDDLLKAFPKGRFLFQVGSGLLACHLAKKDPAGAEAAYERFKNESRSVALDGGGEAQLGMLRGRLLEAQGKNAEAKAVFEVAERTAGAEAAIANEAKLGIARCLLRGGKGSEAEPILRALKDLPDAPNRVYSGAWNGIGDLVKEEGRQKKDPEKLLEALYAYLRGVVQYRPGPGEPTEEYERAQAGAADCFRFISELEKNADRKRLYGERYRERLDQLKKEFPSSPYLAR
ncbi:MAG: tetratricopeptide repeat protein [Planctomycetota bacterium]